MEKVCVASVKFVTFNIPNDDEFAIFKNKESAIEFLKECMSERECFTDDDFGDESMHSIFCEYMQELRTKLFVRTEQHTYQIKEIAVRD